MRLKLLVIVVALLSAGVAFQFSPTADADLLADGSSVCRSEVEAEIGDAKDAFALECGREWNDGLRDQCTWVAEPWHGWVCHEFAPGGLGSETFEGWFSDLKPGSGYEDSNPEEGQSEPPEENEYEGILDALEALEERPLEVPDTPAGFELVATRNRVRVPAVDDFISKGATATGDLGATKSEILSDYWTAERMRSALPAEAPKAVSTETLRARSSTLPALKYAEQTVEAVPPAQAKSAPSYESSNNSAELDGGLDLNQQGLLEQAAADAVANTPSRFEERVTGKIFSTLPDGQTSGCSAVVVNSASKSTVFTASHCLYSRTEDRGGLGWRSNVVFVPGYNNGVEPYGRWAASELWAFESWVDKGSFGQDIGMVVLEPRDGVNVGDVVGGAGLAMNPSNSLEVEVLGYPQRRGDDIDIGLDGSRRSCRNQATLSTVVGSAAFTVFGCPEMGPGASGGPWFATVNGQSGHIVGINSNVFEEPNSLNSSYFGQAPLVLYNATKDR